MTFDGRDDEDTAISPMYKIYSMTKIKSSEKRPLQM